MIRVPIAFVICALAAASWARVPRNAFIAHPAETRSALLAQVERNPAVRDRYQRHFGMTQSELTSYFSTLAMGKLKADGLYEVFNVPKSGVLRSRLLRLRKGTKVWNDANGQPVLMAVCGNPLTRGPKTPVAANPVGVVTGMVAAKELLPFEGYEAPEVAADLEPVALATSSEPVSPELANAPAEGDLGAPTVSAPSVVPATPTSPAGVLAVATPWVLGPGVAGLLVGVPLMLIPGGDESAPVPEPATIVAMGTGALVLIRRRRS